MNKAGLPCHQETCSRPRGQTITQMIYKFPYMTQVLWTKKGAYWRLGGGESLSPNLRSQEGLRVEEEKNTPGRKACDELEGKTRPGWRGRVLEALRSFWKEFSTKGNGDPQKGSEPGKVMVSFASMSRALLADVHSGPPSPHCPLPRRGSLTSGTSCPFSMISDSILPLAEPELTSARRRSPVER